MTTPSFSPILTTPRVAVWDNARFAMMLLVVVAHVISTVRTDTNLGYGLYTYIYLFHMPALILLSGLFSKADTSPKVAKSIWQLVVTWFIWELIWVLINFVDGRKQLPESWLISPAWTLWFLVTLATMRILLPYIVQLRHPLVFSVVLALAAGLSPAIGTQFSASRTLSFLPFFVAGWLAMNRGWLKGDWFMRPSRQHQFLALGLLAFIAAVIAVLAPLRQLWRLDSWLVWRDDYTTLFDTAPVFDWAPTIWWQVALGGASMRLLLLSVAAAMTFAVLLIIPRAQSVATKWGTRTLYVYLLHGPIVFVMRNTGAVEWFGEFGSAGVLMLVAIGIAITLLLSMQWVTKLFWPMVEPRLDQLFTDSSTKSRTRQSHPTVADDRS